MSDDVLERVKAVNEKCQSKDGSIDHRYWAFRSIELLPELIAEVERLRSLNESLMENGNDLRTRCQKAEAKIKEMETDVERLKEALRKRPENLGRKLSARDTEIKRLSGALKEYSLSVGWMLSKQDNQIKRLEAAFLKAEERVLWDEVVVDGPKDGKAARHIEIVQQKAREALERIRNESV